jgi:hypothetical protein
MNRNEASLHHSNWKREAAHPARMNRYCHSSADRNLLMVDLENSLWKTPEKVIGLNSSRTEGVSSVDAYMLIPAVVSDIQWNEDLDDWVDDKQAKTSTFSASSSSSIIHGFGWFLRCLLIFYDLISRPRKAKGSAYVPFLRPFILFSNHCSIFFGLGCFFLAPLLNAILVLLSTSSN